MDVSRITLTPKQEPFVFSTARYSCMSGGYGCSDYNTRILNVDTGEFIKIGEVKKPFYVLTASGKKALALPSCKYEKAPLYEVKFGNNSFTCTLKHKVLTPNGYKEIGELSKGDKIITSDCFFPKKESFLSSVISYVLRGLRIIQGSQVDYQLLSRFYGEQFHGSLNNDPDIFPSQVGVQDTNQIYKDEDNSLDILHEYNSYSLENIFRGAKKYFLYLFLQLLPVFVLVGCIFLKFFEFFFLVIQLIMKFLLNIIIYPCKVLVNQCNISFLNYIQDDLYNLAYKNSTISTNQIQSIKYKKTDHYYDIHVLGEHNYYAEGCFHHNSGKTLAGCVRGLTLSSYPNNRGLIGRLTYPELRTTTRNTFFEICPIEYYDKDKGGRWSPSENHLRLINGSEILFVHLDTISESELKSLNLGWFFIDQAEEISINVVRVLQSRLRLATVPKRYGFFSCNPEPGSWLEPMFKIPFDKGELDSDMFYEDVTTYENPHNPPDYIEDLEKRYPPELQERYLKGSWKVLEDLIYKEFDQNIHVINPFQVPKSWEHIVSLDHGMVNPAACLWAAIDYDYNVFIFDEYYSPGLVSEHSKAIISQTGDQEISLWLIDPSTQARTREKDNKMWSVLEEYEDNGLYFVPANNEKLAGINRVKEFFKVQEDRINPITRQKKSPRLFIFKSCVNLIWELKQYKWKKMRSLQMRNSPEVPVDNADHCCDALYYLILSRFPPPVRKPFGNSMILPADRLNANIISTPMQAPKDPVLGSFYSNPQDGTENMSFEENI